MIFVSVILPSDVLFKHKNLADNHLYKNLKPKQFV